MIQGSPALLASFAGELVALIEKGVLETLSCSLLKYLYYKSAVSSLWFTAETKIANIVLVLYRSLGESGAGID